MAARSAARLSSAITDALSAAEVVVGFAVENSAAPRAKEKIEKTSVRKGIALDLHRSKFGFVELHISEPKELRLYHLDKDCCRFRAQSAHNRTLGNTFEPPWY
jgi:hypothetical protein